MLKKPISSFVIMILCTLLSPAVISAQDSVKQSFVDQAAFSNRFEIEAAKIALEKGKDPAAKQFAQKMIDDHSKSLSDLQQAARAEDISTPSGLDAENTQKIMALKQAPPTDFDQAYFSTQVAAHEKAVALFMAYSKDGPDGSLRNYAGNDVATLRAHNLMVHGLTKK